MSCHRQPAPEDAESIHKQSSMPYHGWSYPHGLHGLVDFRSSSAHVRVLARLGFHFVGLPDPENVVTPYEYLSQRA
jgi:hypothetical protein